MIVVVQYGGFMDLIETIANNYDENKKTTFKIKVVFCLWLLIL